MAEGITNSSETLNVLQKVYSVGALYFNTTDIDPATIFGFGTWVRVAQNMTLWGASANGQGGTTKAAGLPNITGTIGGHNAPFYVGASGAFRASEQRTWQPAQTGGQGCDTVTFNAQLSNSIYGSSTTVQPPALVVNIWRRTA